MKNILCYGDSNTWGFVPGSINFDTLYVERYPYAKRWTGILQNMLGTDYYIIEEGLNGRTTNIDYEEVYGRNGKSVLPISLYSHAPLDLVILMLGLNDLKKEFNRSVDDIAKGIEELIGAVCNSTYGIDMQSPPKILLISPPVLTHENFSEDMFENGIVRGQQFAKVFEEVAIKHHCDFIDANLHIKLSEIDGLHFDETAHAKFAKLMYQKIQYVL